jgi:acyl carrier protein
VIRQQSLDRTDILAMLAVVADRRVEPADERIDSLELARLIYEIERRTGSQLDLDDDELVAMGTVSGIVEVLGAAMARRSDD